MFRWMNWLLTRSKPASDTPEVVNVRESACLTWEIDYATAGDIIRVNLSGKANVYLVDLDNLSLYMQGKPFVCKFQTWAVKTPVDIAAPSDNVWAVIVDLGGCPGRIMASVDVIRNIYLDDTEEDS